jgi:hypothetical protein
MLALVVLGGVARAYAPSVADLDAAARAVGNRRDIAQRIGRRRSAKFRQTSLEATSSSEFGCGA